MRAEYPTNERVMARAYAASEPGLPICREPRARADRRTLECRP
jgi:hypothetical protein